MNIRMACVVAALSDLPFPAFSTRPAPQQTQQDAVAAEKVESQKRLAEIDKVKDDAKRRELLENYTTTS